MTYEQIKNLRTKEFKRLCGVKPQLFKEMVDLLKQELPRSRKRGGQPKLSTEDQLLITLEYWHGHLTILRKIHSLSYTPFKQPKKNSLSCTEKEYNREFARHRIYIEHVIRCLKIFRILAYPYRNRRRRFGLRFNLIAGLYNCGLDLAIAVSAAKAFAAKVGLDITTRMFELTGARATSTRYGFNRYWRDQRTFTLHDPIDYKLRDVGNWLLNEIFPTPSQYS